MALTKAGRYTCELPINRKPCGGIIKPTREYRPVKHEDEGPDFSRRLRVWRCTRCNHVYEELIFRHLMDPDVQNPSVSEFTQLASKGIIKRTG